MNTTDARPDDRDDRALSLAGFILFLVGFFLPILCWACRLPEPLLLTAGGAELLALVFGAMSWSRRLGKIATVGAAIFFLLGVTNLILFHLIR